MTDRYEVKHTSRMAHIYRVTKTDRYTNTSIQHPSRMYKKKSVAGFINGAGGDRHAQTQINSNP